MAIYRKKPVQIQAFQFYEYLDYSNGTVPLWFAKNVENGTVIDNADHLVIKTLEGDHRANAGDYIICGVKGELYPCKPDIFEMTYERVYD
ncbi:PGDYG protein [Phage vB_KsaM-C1]|nr:PGDYG protein [Phage vB_KsaM-C1]